MRPDDDTMTLPQGDGGREPAGEKMDEPRVELCPDELIVLDAIKRAGGHIAPSTLRRKYNFITASVDADYGYGTATVTRLKGRPESMTLDSAGEKATRRALRRETARE